MSAPRLEGRAVCVAGAGAVGAAIALHLVQRGAAVVLCDPAARGDNASGVAAGMLAPGLEAMLDPAGAGGFRLLSQARDAWPAFAAGFGQEAALNRSGALWLGEPAQAQRLADLGARSETISAARAAAMAPGLAHRGEGVLIPDDWRLEPQAMLAAMLRAFEDLGGRYVSQAVAAVSDAGAELTGGETLAADWTVYAGGQPARAGALLAPELAELTPIKGQILKFGASAGPLDGPIVRDASVYVAPSPTGAAAGATMEAGVGDRRPDPETAQRLRAAAATLFPALGKAQAQAMAGVRASSPDGLPLLGRSAARGLILATGARRNGWLMGPMLADMVTRIVADEDPGPWAADFHPARFDAARRLKR